MDSKQQRILARQEKARAESQMHVACVIHGDFYDWSYVENLRAMVSRNLSGPVKFHVFTEHDRPVPADIEKHILTPWPGIEGRKRAWWYKMQLFDPKHFQGHLLYFDLDVVITGSLDWLRDHKTHEFWAIRDYKHLWRPQWQGINSSMMYWDTVRHAYIWEQFRNRDISRLVKEFPGDQDYLSSVITQKDLRFFDESLVQSWRWQVLDGGMDMRTRVYRRPNAGAVLGPKTCVVVCHGRPKPHEIQDAVIQQHWNPAQT